MRMLIIELFNVNRGNKNFIRIASQPLRCENFYNGDTHFRTANGFHLMSSGAPDIHHQGLYVRGRNQGQDNKVMTVPNEKWLDNLSKAVREYNNYLEDTGGVRQRAITSRDIIRRVPNMEVIGLLTVEEETIR